MAANPGVLIAIDVQVGLDDPRYGDRGNPAMEANGRLLLAAWRRAGWPVILVRHDSVEPDSPLRPDHPGNRFKPGFGPEGDEPVIAKSVNSAFIGTDLEQRLRALGAQPLVLFGISTDMCVSTTTRMARNLGFAPTVVGDACYCWAQRDALSGRLFDADTVHAVHLATLAREFATVTGTAALLAGLA